MKKPIIILLLLISVQGFTQDIREYDKQLHFAVGTLISTSVYFVVYYHTGSKFLAVSSAIVATAIVAIGKEIYDQIDYGGFDFKDIKATVYSCSISIPLSLVLGKKFKLKIN